MFNFTARRLARCHNIEDLRRAARRRVPRPMFDYLDGAADDEATMYRNNAGFSRYELVPSVLVDVTEVDMSTTVMGQPIAWPVVLAPTGSSRLFHHEGEMAVVRAARDADTVYSLSSMASVNIEQVAAATDGPKWFQIYVWKDRSVVREFIQRCREAGYHSLTLTVDVQTTGNRERDLRNGMTIPPRLSFGSLVDIALHPYWSWHFLTSPRIRLENVVGKAPDNVASLAAYAQSQLDPSVTWDDMAWMIEEWGGPFAIKGVLSARDAERAVDTGVSAIIISNHGGRQLDQVPAPIDVLPEIADAVGNRAEIILDGGIRRGTDVIKALALGARACMIGRPYLYGLGAGGKAGVDRALQLLRNETRLAMRLAGCTSIRKLNKSFIRLRTP